MRADLRVALITAAAILVLAVVSEWVLDVDLDFISQYAPVWMYMIYVTRKDKTEPSTMFWSMAIVIVTLAVLLVYAL